MSVVPDAFLDRVCGCTGDRAGFTNPVNWRHLAAKGEPWASAVKQYTLKFDWWVCGKCYKPAPLNAINARLIRECEICEDDYLISTWPDKMDLCADCL